MSSKVMYKVNTSSVSIIVAIRRRVDRDCLLSLVQLVIYRAITRCRSGKCDWVNRGTAGYRCYKRKRGGYGYAVQDEGGEGAGGADHHRPARQSLVAQACEVGKQAREEGIAYTKDKYMRLYDMRETARESEAE